MGFLAVSLINVFKLSGKETLGFFFTVFNGGNADAFTSGSHVEAGVFGDLYKLFVYCAFAIIFLNLLYQIFKAFFGPLASAESPTRVIFKSSVIALMVTFAQSIVALVFEISQIPFDAVSEDIPISIADVGEKITKNIINTNHGYEADFNSLISFLDGFLLGAGFWSSVLCIVLFFMLIKQFMMLALELAERYLMLGILTIIAPLCIACGAVRGLEDVLKNWISWVINGCIVMIFTTLFLGVFICNFNAQANIPYLLMWIAWFKTGQKIDEHMNALGLKTAKTGGFGLDVMNAMRTGLPMAMQAANGIMGTNFGIPFAPPGRNGKIDNNDKSWQRTLGIANPATGGKTSGLLGAFQQAAFKADKSGKFKEVSDDGQKGISKILNTAKGAFTGEKFGKNSQLSHDELSEMLQNPNKLPKDPQARKDAMQDMLEMKGGKNLADKLKNSGYNLEAISQDKKGDVAFTARDKDNNEIKGKLSEMADPNSSIGVKGDDGVERGLVASALINPNSENSQNPLASIDDNVKNDRNNIFGANQENMTQSGIIGEGGKIEANGEETPIYDSDVKANGTIQRYNENGEKDDNGGFVRMNDGTEEGKLVPESQIQSSGIEQLSSDSMTKDGESIQNYNNVPDVEGNMHQINPSSIQEQDGQMYAKDANTGESFTIDDSDVKLSNDSGRSINASDFTEHSVHGGGTIVQGVGDNGQGDGTFFKTIDSRRYDSQGNLDPNGGYMMTEGANGINTLQSVKTENGNVLSYQMKDSAQATVCTPSGDFAEMSKTNISQNFRPAESNEIPTHLGFNGNTYSCYSDDVLGPNSVRQYVEHGSGTGNYMAVDTYNNKFNEQGRVIPDENGNINVVGKDGNRKSMSASEFSGYNSNTDDGYSNISSYYKTYNPVTNSASYINNKEGQVQFQTVASSSYNGVPTNIDLKNASVAPILDRYGNDTGVRNITLKDGTKYTQYTGNYDTSSAYGAYLEFGGQRTFLEPNPGNDMIRALNNSNIDISKSFTDYALNTNDINYKQLAHSLGIPSDAKNVSMTNGSKGVCITYLSGGHTHAITSAPVTGTNTKQEPITKSIRLSDASTKEIPIGYHMIIKDSVPNVKNLSNKFFDTANIKAKFGTKYRDKNDLNKK